MNYLRVLVFAALTLGLAGCGARVQPQAETDVINPPITASETIPPTDTDPYQSEREPVAFDCSEINAARAVRNVCGKDYPPNSQKQVDKTTEVYAGPYGPTACTYVFGYELSKNVPVDTGGFFTGITVHARKYPSHEAAVARYQREDKQYKSGPLGDDDKETFERWNSVNNYEAFYYAYSGAGFFEAVKGNMIVIMAPGVARCVNPTQEFSKSDKAKSKLLFEAILNNVTADVSSTSDCGDSQGCFEKKFTACTPATVFIEAGFGPIRYRIIGPVSGGCAVETLYTDNPDPKLINKEMICALDTKMGFLPAIRAEFSGILEGSVVCTGPLYTLLRSM
ncbi:MAG: hypothetical protein Q7S66_01485 [bacterium]|nr:hypothetical protein [bacterium]